MAIKFMTTIVFLTTFLSASNNIGIQIGDKKFSSGKTDYSQNSVNENCKFKLKNFTKLNLKTVLLVKIEAGKEPSCKITADKNIASIISFDQKGDTLTIDSKKSFSTEGDLQIYLSTKKLEAITSNTASTIKFSNVNSDKLILKFYGASFVIGKGRVKNLGVVAKGSVEVNLKELKAKNAVVKTDGSSEVYLWVEDYLDAKSKGASEIIYRGNPRKIKKEAKEASEISRED